MSKLKTRGSGNAQAKLTESKVRAILRAYDSGIYTQRDLSRHYDMSRTQIHRIVHRENWRHVSKSHTSNQSVINQLKKST